MTAIPGTAMPEPAPPEEPKATTSKSKLPLASLPVHEDEMVVTSESGGGTVKGDDGKDEDLPWKQTLLAWMTFGTILGVLASIIGLRIANLLVLAPLGPTVGAIAWYVRKFAKKNLSKFEPLN